MPVRGRGVLAVVVCCAVPLVTACGVRSGTAGTSGSPSPRSGTGSTAVLKAATSNPSGPVPWLADVASEYVAPVPPPPPAPVARYAACAASQLSGRPGSSSAGAGNIYNYFFLTNTGAGACSIEGGPSSAVAFGVDGTQLALSTAAMDGWGSLAGPPVNLEPGQSAQAVTDSAPGGICSAAAARSYTLAALAIGVGASGSVSVSFPPGQPLTLDYCGSVVPLLLGFGTPVPSETPPPSPLDVLTVSRSMPATVTAGGTADYTVTLTNPTSRPVALSSCPSYAEFMVAAGAGQRTDPVKSTYYYYLNCQAVPEIPGRGAVTFAMEIPVPAAAGPAKYGWQLQDTSVQTGGVTTVTAG